MDLYDPDRAHEIIYLGLLRDWDSFQGALRQAIGPIESRHGEGFQILTETVISPTLGVQLQAVLKKFPAAKWRQFDPAGPHSARAAAQMVFGRPVHTYLQARHRRYRGFARCGFFACGPGSTRHARDFSTRRRQGDRLDMNRLYVIESTMTPTGGKADHRLALRYAEVEEFARELAAALGVGTVLRQRHAPVVGDALGARSPGAPRRYRDYSGRASIPGRTRPGACHERSTRQ